MKQGAKANYTGKQAVNFICDILKRKGYHYEREYCIGMSIYGTPLKVDIFVQGVPGYLEGLVIESKWQSTSGSVDEKFPYLVENIRRRHSCPTVIVLAGGGCREGAEKWLRSQVGGRLEAVMNMEEFAQWMMNLADAPVSWGLGLFELQPQ